MTVTTSCFSCLRTITVPLAIFDLRPFAVCRDAGRRCRQAGDCS
jgi:hypothetical protein